MAERDPRNRRTGGSSGGGGGSSLNEPGPTAVDRTDSAAQVPAGAAEKAVEQNRTAARNTLNRTLPGADPRDIGQLEQQAETGFGTEALTTVGMMAGWLDGPRQAINLLIQDLKGGAAAEGQRNPNIGDYWNTLWGGVEDIDGFETATGLNPWSGSDTLDLFGWNLADEDDIEGRFLRGLGDFGLQVLTDPITYVTFGLGGIAKKAALAGGRALQLDAITNVSRAVKMSKFGTASANARLTTNYQKLLFSQRSELVSGYKKKIAGWMDENGGALPERYAHSMRRTVGSDDVAKMNDDQILELAVADRVHDDLLRPLAGKDFGNISDDIFDELPSYMKGGTRINIPFWSGFGKEGMSGLGKGAGGILIPGTTGLGRTIVGKPFREMRDFARGHIGAVDRTLNTLEDAVVQMNRSAPLVRAMRAPAAEGGVEGWQFHILESTKENLIRRNAKHEISTDLNSMWKEIEELAEITGDGLDDVGADIWRRMEGQNVDDVMLRQAQELHGLDPDDLTGLQSGLANVYANPEMDNAIHGMVTYLQEVMGDYHAALSSLDPAFKEKFIKGYIPHKATTEGHEWLLNLARSKASIPTGNGNAAEDLASAILNSAGTNGVADAAQGATGHVGRTHGRLQALHWTDDGFTMLNEDALKLMNTKQLVDGQVTTETRYMITPDLNEQIVPILERVGREQGVPLPKNWNGKLYNENPIEVTIGYIDSMNEAVEVWQHVDGLMRAGLASRHSTDINMQKTIQNMQDQASGLMNDMPTTKFGKPVEGATESMPIEWLDNIADADSVGQAIQDVASGEYDSLVSSLRRDGFDPKRPMVVGVKPDGQLGLMDGHHRLEAAGQMGMESAPVEYIPVPQDTPGFTGNKFLHDMKEGWHEEATAIYDANVRARGEALGKGVPPQRAQWVASDVMNQTSWTGKPINENILDGTQKVPGVPTPVHDDMTKIGLTINNLEDVEAARHLARAVAAGEVSTLIEKTPIPRPNHFAGVENIEHAAVKGWSSEGADFFLGNGKQTTVVASLDRGVFRISIAPNLGLDGVNKAKSDIVDFLDDQFMNGRLKGQFSDAGIGDIIGEGLDSQSGQLLHEYLRRKMGTLEPEAMEFLAKEPAEIFQGRLLADDFINKYRETIQSHAAVMDSEGNLVRGGRDATITPDSLARERFAELEKAGRMAGDAGYEAISKVMNDVVEYVGVRDVPGMVNPNTFNLSGPAIDGLQMQKDMAQYLSLIARNHAMMSTPQGIAAAKLAANRGLKWWKAAATIPRPAFHIRNAIGGTYQNLVSGVTPASHALAAANTVKWRNTLRTHRGPGALEAAFKSVDPKLQKTFRAAYDEGVLNGFSTTEFSSALSPRQKKNVLAYANVFDTDGFAMNRAGARVMESTEDFMRMSMFIQYYDDAVPNSSLFAREMVNGTHFDYSDLTPFETKIKSIIPFYVWTRRNIPLQLRQAIENPRLIQRYGAMMRSMHDNMGGNDPLNLEEADHFSAWAAGTDHKVNPETPFWARVMIDPDLPLSDLLELDLNPIDSIASLENRLGPHLTVLQDMNAQRDFGDVNAPTTLPGVWQSLAAVGVFDRHPNGNVRIPYALRTLMETVFPFQRDLADLVGGPTDPNRQARVGITQDDGFLEKSAKTLAGSFLGGTGIKTTTPADTRQAAYRQSVEHQQRVKEMRLRGELPDDN